MSTRHTWILNGLTGALALLSVATAQAGDAADKPEAANEPAATSSGAEADDSSTLSEVIVTGTSIKRADAAALPVTIMTTDEMKLRDGNTPADMLTALPTVVSVPINDSAQGGAGARGDVAAVNLRGLGSGNTLVLLNGRRVASYGISSTENSVPELSVNVNVLPNIGLERVDVLRDGASSLYGSDAVAGVINFVTDNNYVGTEATVQSRYAEVGSGSELGFNAKHGQDLFSGRAHWTSTLDVMYRQELYAADAGRGVDADKQSLVPGAWSTVGAFNDRTASSGYATFIGKMPGTTKSATYYIVPTAGGVGYTSTPTADQKFATTFNVNSVGYSQPESKRINWFNSFDFKLNDKTTLYTELALYRAESLMERPPVAYGAGSDTAAVVPAGNPYNPFGSAYFGAAGVPVTLNAIRFIDDGPEMIRDNSDFARWVGGARGEIAGSWTYDTALLYTINHVTDTSENAIRESPWEQYSLVQTDASKAYNPFFYTFAGTGSSAVGTPYTNTAAQLAPFVQHFHQNGKHIITSWDGHVNGDLFNLPAGAVKLAAGGEFRYEDYALTRPLYAGLNCQPGPGLGACPAQSTALTTADGYIVQSTNNDFVQASASGNVIGDRTVAAGFAETVIPVFSAQNALPLLQQLELSAAVRYEHYSDFGSTTNPKFSFDWRPESHVLVRGSFEHGFRAPNLAALNTPTRSSVGTGTDSYYNGVSGLGVNDGSAQRFTTTGVNGTLGPEKAESGSFGVVIDVPWVEGLSFSADYWKIHQKGLIAAPSSASVQTAETAALKGATQTLLSQGQTLASITPAMLASTLGSSCTNNPLTNALTYTSYQDAATGAAVYRSCAVDPATAAAANAAGLAAAGTLYNTYLPFANLASATEDGIDFNITYKSPMFAIGRFQVISDSAWLADFQRRTTATSAVQHYLALQGASKWRANLNLLWYYGGWSAGVSAYYIGDYADQNATIATSSLANVPANSVYTIDGIHYWKVASSITENAFMSYTFSTTNRILDGGTIRAGVNNLSNRLPPLTSDPAGYDATVYQSLAQGRVWSLAITKKF
ncbi:MAG TPA: TonB-dependent receptor [Steroidobacteraceae bacterium]|nr:TonB-dependent receptor [Steroidobacteraceae bacterium]